MFVELSLDNFQGIMNPISIDFKALSKKRDKSKYFLTHDNLKINKIIGITGANASGKSSVVNATKYIKEFIFDDVNIEKKKEKFIYAQNDETRTTTLSCVLYISSADELEKGYYKYSLEYSIRGISEKLQYKRNYINDWMEVLEFNSENFISDITFKFKYYRNLITHYGKDDKAAAELKYCKAFYEYITERCLNQDSIVDLTNSLKYMNEKRQKNILKALNSCVSLVDSSIVKSEFEDNVLSFKTNKGKWIKLEDLSTGTKKFIKFSIYLSKIMFNKGTLICDKIENNFNFDLLKYIFMIFSTKEQIQLFFTTNNKYIFDIRYNDNTRLIDIEQIYIIEKNIFKTILKNNMIRYDKLFSKYYDIPESEKYEDLSNYFTKYEKDE